MVKKIEKKTKVKWLASETTRGIKVHLLVDGEKLKIGDWRNELFFETIEQVKAYCKGEIVFTKRKVVVSKNTIVSK